MIENKKRLYIFGTAALSVLVILVIYFTLIASGAVNLLQNNLVISSESVTKVYDGEVLLSHEYEVKSGKIKTKETLSVTFTEEITDIGVVENKFFVIITDENDNIVTNKYDITYVYGKLEVRALPLKISTQSEVKMYDGTQLVNKNWNLLSGSMLEGHEMEVTVTGLINSVGTTPNDFYIVVLNEYGIDVTSMYDVEKELGTLVITEKQMTITSGSDKKEYDGIALTSDVFYYEESDLVDGHTISIHSNAYQTTPGSASNTFSYVIRDKDGLDVTGCYGVYEKYGNLIVTTKEITVSSATDSKEYDGTALSNEEITHSELLDGHKLTAHDFTTLTDVTEKPIDNSFRYTIVDENGTNISAYYNVSKDTGTLTITKKVVTITSKDIQLAYTGEEQFNEEFEVSQFTPLLTGHTMKLDKSFGESIPGTYQNNNTFIILDENDNNVSTNYSISASLGSMTILAIDLIFSSKDTTKIFSGLEFESDEYSFANGVLLDGHSYAINNKNKIKNVGTVEATFSVDILDEDLNDVSKYYNILIVPGKLEVTPFSVTIFTSNFNYVYSGDEYYLNNLPDENVPEYTPLPIGYEFDYDFGNEMIKNVGSLENSCIYSVYGEDGLSNNFSFKEYFGFVTVIQHEVTIMTNSGVFEYDGEKHSVESYKVVTGNESALTLVLTGDGYLKFTEVGCYYNVVSFKVYEKGNTDEETLNYKLNILSGNITIYDKLTVPISLTVKSDKVMYTGNEITHGSLFASNDNLIGFEYWLMQGYSYNATVTTNGSAISVGIYTVVVGSIIIRDASGEDVTDTFEIFYTSGTLEIVDQSITISSDDISKTYDGIKLLQDESNVVISGIDSSLYDYKLDLFGGQLNVGSSYMYYELIIYEKGTDNDVTSQFKIINKLGKLTVTAVQVEISYNEFNANSGDTYGSINIIGNYTIDSKYSVEIILDENPELTFVSGNSYSLTVKYRVTMDGEDVSGNFVFSTYSITVKVV